MGDRTRHICGTCGRGFSTPYVLRRHIRENHDMQRRRRRPCHTCGQTFASRQRLDTHVCSGRRVRQRHLVRDPTYDDPVQDPPVVNPPELGAVYQQNWASIRSSLYRRQYQDILNCRLLREDGDVAPEDPSTAVTRVWTSLDHVLKVNISFGVILRHTTSGRLRYYHASSNNATIFPTARTISDRQDLARLLDDYKGFDVGQQGLNRRQNSSWVLHKVTNVTFYIYKLSGVNRVGATTSPSKHVLDSRSIISLYKCKSTGKPWNDNLCFFRCLAVEHHIQGTSGQLVKHDRRCSPLQSHTHDLYNKWKQHRDEFRDVAGSQFPGVRIEDLWEIEDVFDVTVCVLSLHSDNSSHVVWSSGRKKSFQLNLNLDNDHFGLITDVSTYASCFACKTCNRVFTTKRRTETHVCATRDSTKFLFKGEPFVQSKTVFDKLSDIGISVKEEDRHYPYRITYDIETFMDKTNVPPPSSQCVYEAVHVLMSISVCSNVPGFTEPTCFVSSGDSKETVCRFVDYLLLIACRAKQCLYGKFRKQREDLARLCDVMDKREEVEEVKQLVGSVQGVWEGRGRLNKLEDDFERYLSVIPVVSFNGQKYDINVMKADLIQSLMEADPASEQDGQKIRFTIKRQASMTCFESAHLRFVDITNFIAPGSNYAGYLKAFGVDEPKGFFPYEWVDDLSKLKHTSLPPQEAFYSHLKGVGITDDDYLFCQRVWKEGKMKTMRDFLVWYNNCDVEPFLKAIQAQVDIYKSKGIDMFKTSVSLPGAAQRWMMSTSDKSRSVLSRDGWVKFFLQNNNDMITSYITDSIPVCNIHHQYKELYDICRKNMIGGPSIVFHRYHENGLTDLRECDYGSSSKKCGLIQGFDANALYAFCVAQPQPVGHPVRCEYKDGKLSGSLHPATSGWSVAAHTWLEFISCRDGLDIQHKHNGKEMRLGRHAVKVDGFCAANQTVYEFMGCYWHGHSCLKCADSDEQKQRLTMTRKRLQYLVELGYELEVIWECEWKEMVKTQREVRDFVQIFESVWYPKQLVLASAESVVDAVKSGEFFGLVQCDIFVPDHLLTKFSEMSPVFGHLEISYDLLSPHMQDFVKVREWSMSTQKALVGAAAATNILLHSELLRWYLSEGMVVSAVHKTYRYKKKVIFGDFVEQATDSRRRGDSDPSLTLHANMAKLSVNSVYGKTITNKENHKNVRYATEPEVISSYIASDKFVSLDEIGDQVCELVHQKVSMDMDVPVIVGFCILQLAKLKMLQFYYNCIDKYVDRTDFQYVEMDTDSAYMALSAPLSDIIRPSLRREFFTNYGRWFPRQACQQHESEFIESKLTKKDWQQQECCRAVTKYDSRTPGLFKEEFRGTGIVALNSKTYVCWDDDTGVTKSSAKGISKRLNKLEASTYKSVLQSQTPYAGNNRGFIKKDNKIVTYQQSRTGITYYYGKRQVQADGVSTSPLDVTLQF